MCKDDVEVNGAQDQTNFHANPYLTVRQAAERLKLKPATLDKWRQLGKGPLFRTHGRRIVYHINDLDAWSGAQQRQTARRYRKPGNALNHDGGIR